MERPRADLDERDDEDCFPAEDRAGDPDLDLEDEDRPPDVDFDLELPPLDDLDLDELDPPDDRPRDAAVGREACARGARRAEGLREAGPQRRLNAKFDSVDR